MDFAGAIAQFLLGGVFCLSVVAKLRRPHAFVSTVVAYQLVPASLTAPAAWAIIAVEGFLAITFLAGQFVYVAIPVAGVLLVLFLASVTAALRARRHVPCGCFARPEEILSTLTVARLIVLLGMVALLSLDHSSTRSSTGLWVMVTNADDRGEALLAAAAAGLVLFGAWMAGRSKLLRLAGMAIAGCPPTRVARAGKDGR